MDRVRERAFHLFADRGLTEGRALDDWLTAEREICWPAAEFAERDSNYLLSVALPGFEPTDITVTATPRELIIKAAKAGRTQEKEPPQQSDSIGWSELSRDEAWRRIELPADIAVDKVIATLRNGMLEIVAPKAKAIKPVEVKVEKVDIAA